MMHALRESTVWRQQELQDETNAIVTQHTGPKEEWQRSVPESTSSEELPLEAERR